MKRKADEITRFKEWIVSRGAALLVATSEWELCRFKADGVTSIIYTDKKGTRSYTGQAEPAMAAFRKGDFSYRPGLAEGQSKRGRRSSDRAHA